MAVLGKGGVLRAFLALLGLPLVSLTANATTCQPPDRDVYIGGTHDFATLADPAASAMLRATGRVGLYTHGAAVTAAFNDHTLPAIYRAFAETGNGIGEIGYGQLQNRVYMDGAYLAFYDNGGMPVGAVGQRPWAMLDNAPDDFLPGRLSDGSTNIWNPSGTRQTVAGWEAERKAAARRNIPLVVPIISPNDDVGLRSDPATSPDWALARAIATAMQSVAIDAPPHYFLGGNVGIADATRLYQAWLIGFVHWAAAQRLRIFWIISPDRSGPAFLSDTIAEIAFLQTHDALPHYWVVENYDAQNPNVVGSETQPQSVAAVALWVAQHAATRPLPAAATPLSGRSPVDCGSLRR